MTISWTGGEPVVEVVKVRGRLNGYRITYGPQILGHRATRRSARRLARRAQALISLRRVQEIAGGER